MTPGTPASGSQPSVPTTDHVTSRQRRSERRLCTALRALGTLKQADQAPSPKLQGSWGKRVASEQCQHAEPPETVGLPPARVKAASDWQGMPALAVHDDFKAASQHNVLPA